MLEHVSTKRQTFLNKKSYLKSDEAASSKLTPNVVE